MVLYNTTQPAELFWSLGIVQPPPPPRAQESPCSRTTLWLHGPFPNITCLFTDLGLTIPGMVYT